MEDGGGSEGQVRGPVASTLAGGVDGIAEDGRSGDQGGLAGTGRWLHGSGTSEVRERRAAICRGAVFDIAVSRAPERFQRVGAVSGGGGVGRVAAFERNLSAVAGGRFV